MPVLTLAETLAIAAPERDRLVEADDAIRDVVSAVEEIARRDGLDERLMSRALVDVMIAAAARKALTAYPSIPRDALADASALWPQRLLNMLRDAWWRRSAASLAELTDVAEPAPVDTAVRLTKSAASARVTGRTKRASAARSTVNSAVEGIPIVPEIPVLIVDPAPNITVSNGFIAYCPTPRRSAISGSMTFSVG